MAAFSTFETTRSANGRVILAKSARKPAASGKKPDAADPIHRAIRKT